MKKLISLLLTLALLACILPAAAADPVTIPGPVVVDDGTTQTITGDVVVSVNNGTAVTADGAGSEVTVNGSAASTGSNGIGAYAHDGGEVIIAGSGDTNPGNATGGGGGAGANASGTGENGKASTVTVNGDAIAGNDGFGANAANGGTVTVTGDAKAGVGENETDGTGAKASLGGTVVVGGSAIAGDKGTGAKASLGGTVEVGGSAIAGEPGGSVNEKAVGAWADGENSIVTVGTEGTKEDPGYAKAGGHGEGGHAYGAYASNGGTVIVGTEDAPGYAETGEGIYAYGAYAYGENSKVTVTGSAKAGYNGIGAIAEGGIVEIGQSTTGGNSGAGAFALKGGTVTVGGSATAGDKGAGAYAENGGRIEVGGDAIAGAGGTGAKAVNGGTVEVLGTEENPGSVTAGDHGYGAYAEGADENGKASTVTVNGDVKAGMKDGEENGTGAYAYNGGAVTIDGNVEAGANGKGLWVDNGSATVSGSVSASGQSGRGIDLRQNGRVSVVGDVSANVGAVIHTDDGDGSGALVVEGTLSGTERDIQIEGVTGARLPDIVVGTLGNGTEPNIEGAEGSPVTFNDVIKAVQYIVKAQGMTVSGAGTYQNKLTGDKYDVANEDAELTFSAAAQEGYRLLSLDFGSYADSAIDNGDGTYTVTVRRGGDLNFEAIFEKIKEEKEKDQEREPAKAEEPVKAEAKEKKEKKTYAAPAIRVAFDEETPAVSAASRAVKAAVTCSDMAYAQKQFASVTFRVDGKAEDARYFAVTLDAEGRLEIALAEELLASLEAGAHTVEMRLANGKVIRFGITVA